MIAMRIGHLRRQFVRITLTCLVIGKALARAGQKTIAFFLTPLATSAYTSSGLWLQCAIVSVSLLLLARTSIVSEIAINAANFVAVAMTIRSTPWERVFWTFIVFSLLGFQSYASSIDKLIQAVHQETESLSQQQRFDSIVRGFQGTVLGLDQTAKKLEALARAARVTEELSEENLQTQTGGDSFAFVYPAVSTQLPLFSLKIHNQGKYPLDVSRFTLDRVLDGFPQPETAFRSIAEREPVQVGILAAHEGRNLRLPEIFPVLRRDHYAVYEAIVNAQNRGVGELLIFRSAKDSNGLAFKLFVWRDSSRKEDLKRGSRSSIQCLITTPWIEPTPVDQPDVFRPQDPKQKVQQACNIRKFFLEFGTTEPRR